MQDRNGKELAVGDPLVLGTVAEIRDDGTIVVDMFGGESVAPWQAMFGAKRVERAPQLEQSKKELLQRCRILRNRGVVVTCTLDEVRRGLV